MKLDRERVYLNKNYEKTPIIAGDQIGGGGGGGSGAGTASNKDEAETGGGMGGGPRVDNAEHGGIGSGTGTGVSPQNMKNKKNRFIWIFKVISKLKNKFIDKENSGEKYE